jgi:hypothetical protein
VRNGVQGALVGVWLRWDAVHYLRIAQEGYKPDERSAFFPLYPLIARAANGLTAGNQLVALLVVSRVACLLAFIVLCGLVERQYGLRLGIWTLALVGLYPMAFLLIAPYPQSLLLLFALLTYRWSLEGRWLLSFVASVAAGLTHVTAAPLVMLLGWEAWKASGPRKLMGFLVALGPLLGIGLFLAWRNQQGYPAYTAMLAGIWGREPLSISQMLASLLRAILSPISLLRGWQNAVAALLATVSIIWLIQRGQVGMALYLGALVAFLFYGSAGQELLSGFARYILIGFPMFIAMASAADRKVPKRLVFVVAATLQLYFSGLFFLWGFIG